MKVHYQAPAHQIAEYVQGIFILEDAEVGNGFALPLFANGMPSLIFQTSAGTVGSYTGHLTLLGQMVTPQYLHLKESFTLIAYYLKPWTLQPLFGISASELAGNWIDMEYTDRAFSLREKLLHAASVPAMICMLDNYILSLALKTKTEHRVVQYAASAIMANPDKDILAVLQRELSVTERTFQRIFGREIGLSPNQFRRINQFQQAFQQLNTGRYNQITEIAFNHGYADQSHYIRAFKEFTGLTPREYLQLSGQL